MSNTVEQVWHGIDEGTDGDGFMSPLKLGNGLFFKNWKLKRCIF